MNQDNLNYLSYLLRLWQTNDKERDEARWRASLKDVGTGEQKGFTSLEALFDFLRKQAGVESDQSDEN